MERKIEIILAITIFLLFFSVKSNSSNSSLKLIDVGENKDFFDVVVCHNQIYSLGFTEDDKGAFFYLANKQSNDARWSQKVKSIFIPSSDVYFAKLLCNENTLYLYYYVKEINNFNLIRMKLIPSINALANEGVFYTSIDYSQLKEILLLGPNNKTLLVFNKDKGAEFVLLWQNKTIESRFSLPITVDQVRSVFWQHVNFIFTSGKEFSNNKLIYFKLKEANNLDSIWIAYQSKNRFKFYIDNDFSEKLMISLFEIYPEKNEIKQLISSENSFLFKKEAILFSLNKDLDILNFLTLNKTVFIAVHSKSKPHYISLFSTKTLREELSSPINWPKPQDLVLKKAMLFINPPHIFWQKKNAPVPVVDFTHILDSDFFEKPENGPTKEPKREERIIEQEDLPKTVYSEEIIPDSSKYTTSYILTIFFSFIFVCLMFLVLFRFKNKSLVSKYEKTEITLLDELVMPNEQFDTVIQKNPHIILEFNARASLDRLFDAILLFTPSDVMLNVSQLKEAYPLFKLEKKNHIAVFAGIDHNEDIHAIKIDANTHKDEKLLLCTIYGPYPFLNEHIEVILLNRLQELEYEMRQKGREKSSKILAYKRPDCP